MSERLLPENNRGEHLRTNPHVAHDPAEMPFTEHLRELRTRLVRALVGIGLVSCITYSYSAELFLFLVQPLERAMSSLDTVAGTTPQMELIGTGPVEAFMVKLKVGIAFGFILSAPWWFYQGWLFVAPALHSHERKFALPFVFISTVCFLLGISFAFFAVFPPAFTFFFEEFGSIGVKAAIRVDEYLGFVVKLALVFGVVFELPILSYFLARVGLLTHQWLLKNFRWMIVGIFVIAGILTPPDIVSQLLLAGPLFVVYLVCIAVTKWTVESVAKRRSTTPEGELPR